MWKYENKMHLSIYKFFKQTYLTLQSISDRFWNIRSKLIFDIETEQNLEQNLREEQDGYTSLGKYLSGNWLVEELPA